MPARSLSPRLKRWIVGLVLAGLLGWVTFLDSHSLLKRFGWHQEVAQLTEENRQLRQDIRALQEKLEAPPSDALVERIAREQYGMHKPGETVYRIED